MLQNLLDLIQVNGSQTGVQEPLDSLHFSSNSTWTWINVDCLEVDRQGPLRITDLCDEAVCTLDE